MAFSKRTATLWRSVRGELRLWRSVRGQLYLGEGEHPELQGCMDTRSKLTLVWGTQSISNFLLEETFMAPGH